MAGTTGFCVSRSLSRLARCNRVDSVEAKGCWEEEKVDEGSLTEGLRAEAWHLKLGHLVIACNLWML